MTCIGVDLSGLDEFLQLIVANFNPPGIPTMATGRDCLLALVGNGNYRFGNPAFANLPILKNHLKSDLCLCGAVGSMLLYFTLSENGMLRPSSILITTECFSLPEFRRKIRQDDGALVAAVNAMGAPKDLPSTLRMTRPGALGRACAASYATIERKARMVVESNQSGHSCSTRQSISGSSPHLQHRRPHVTRPVLQAPSFRSQVRLHRSA